MRSTAVLLVDDRRENLLALEAVLAPLDCRLLTARSGEEALKVLLQHEVACILLDVQMPGMDGFETAELIRGRERTRLVPIIFVTAISKEPDHVFRGYTAGAVDYLFKPFDPVVLRSKVEVFVELHERGQALAEREELLRAMFEDAPIGMARADADGALRHVNSALCATLGRSAEQLVGLTLDELGLAAEAGVDTGPRAELLAGRSERFEVERRLRGPRGSEIPVLVSASLARTAHGRAPDVILQIQDIGDRKRAEQGRLALARAQADRARAEATAERLRVVEAISEAALGTGDLDTLLRVLLDRLLATLSVDGAAIVLLGDDARTVAQAPGGVGILVEGAERARNDHVVARVRDEGGPVAVPDVVAAGIDAGSLGPDVTSVLAAPLMVAGEPIGSLHVGTVAARRFDDEALDLVRVAADRAGTAIVRTRLYEREHRIASELQRTLLPKALPEVPGVAMAARYAPGGDGTAVGGDWYDAIALPGGRVALAIGDVVGRGIEAASTMGQLRSALRALLMHDDDTGTIADRLNRFALGLGDSMMATVVVAVLEPATGRLRYTNAGHPPSLVVDPDGRGRFLEDAPSPPLGVVESPRYPQHELVLPPGAILVHYTDGLVEKPGEVLDVGLARLRDAAEGAVEDVEGLCDALLAAGAEEQASDDVTLLVVRATTTLADRLQLEVAGEPDALVATRDAIRRWLGEAGATSAEVHDITMACNEACQNVIEHAYTMGADLFGLTIARENGDVHVEVADRGAWQTTESPDRGRGIELMRRLMDEVEIDAGAMGTTVRMRRALLRGV